MTPSKWLAVRDLPRLPSGKLDANSSQKILAEHPTVEDADFFAQSTSGL
jgi:hypothetical protein